MDLLASLSDPHLVLELLGALSGLAMLLSAVGMLWKSSLRVFAEMAEDIDDYRLKRRASKARLRIDHPIRDITVSRG